MIFIDSGKNRSLEEPILNHRPAGIRVDWKQGGNSEKKKITLLHSVTNIGLYRA